MAPDAIATLLDPLSTDPPRIVCLPDLFVDHFVHLDDWPSTQHRLERTLAQGGGNLLDTPQSMHPGGNAANTAWALARLGAHVHLAGPTPPHTRALFEDTLAEDGVNLDHVTPSPTTSLTTILSVGDPPANAMFNDPGPLATYDPADLPTGIEATIQHADALVIANWASLTHHGTDLLKHLLPLAHAHDTFTYFDAADPTERPQPAIDTLLDTLEHHPLDAWAMNQTEAHAFTTQREPERAAKRLAERTQATVTVHGHDTAITHDGNDATRVPAYTLDTIHRATGAGDAFNAGNLLGHLSNATPETRLTLAHATAATFLARAPRQPPTRDHVASFVDDAP